MIEFAYDNIIFHDREDFVVAKFLKIFRFEIPKEKLERLGRYYVKDGSILYPDGNDSLEHKFNLFLQEGFTKLKNFNNKKAIYIHRDSGIPLFGSNSIGLVDRGTNIIEVKPITSCNINCIYCSVNEDKRIVDYVVEADYLIEEFQKLADLKNSDHLEAHIGTQGEPLLYADLAYLIHGLSKINGVKTISIDTNATMLNKEVIDNLVKSGLTRFNVSINAFSQENAEKIADAPYDLNKIKENIEYISTVADLIIAPVLIPKINEQDIDDIVGYIADLKKRNNKFSIILGIQNYLKYKSGRNPVKPWRMEKFFDYLKKLEQKHDISLLLSEDDFSIEKCKTLENPFRKGEQITVKIFGPGRMPNEKIAVARGRVITFTDDFNRSGNVKLTITRIKHNVIYGRI